MTNPLRQVLELPVPERVKLVQDIWDSVVEVPDALPLTDRERQELDRRLDDYERNPKLGVPWAELKARLLASR